MAVEGDESSSAVNEPATVPGPAPYEEELKDYEHEGKEDLIDNMPDAHPQPKPSKEEKAKKF